MDTNITKTQGFLKKAFQGNPSYSFDDWRIMFNHSVKVKDIAIKVAKKIKADEDVTAIAALLHDIGKTEKGISKEWLERHHVDYNYKVAGSLINDLSLTKSQKEKIKKIIQYKDSSPVMKIVKDADAIAFFVDDKLQKAFFTWALKNKKRNSVLRKFEKFDKLNFTFSKALSQKAYNKMVTEWKPKLEKIS